MNKYFQRICLSPVLLLFTALPTVHGQHIPDALLRKIQGKTTLTGIMQEVREYYNSEEAAEEKEEEREEEEFESPMSFWHKWERYMAPRLNARGELVNVQAHLISMYDTLQAREAVARLAGNTTSRWTFAGPFSMNYYGGQYRGLGRLDCIAFHPTNANIFWVGSPGGGVWRTNDGGATWVCISFNLPTMAVSSIAVSPSNPDVIYLLTGDPNGGSFRGLYNHNSSNAGTFVWKTEDGGFNWIRIANLPAGTAFGNKIIVHPNNPNTIYVGHERGLSRSTNGGISWLPQTELNQVTDVAFKPGSPSTIYIATLFGVNYSTNDGISFSGSTIATTANTRKLLATTSANANVLYVLCSGVGSSGTYRGIFRSINSGVDFTLRSTTPNIFTSATAGNDMADFSGYCYAFAVNPTNASNVIAAGTIIWGSTDGGVTMNNYTDYAENTANLSRYVHPDIHGLGFNPLNGNLYSVNDGGIWRSTNAGIAWADITANIHTSTFYSLAGFAGNANLLAGGNQDNGVKYRNNSVPYAGDFTHVAGGDGFDAAFDATNSNRWYASGNDQVYRFNQGVYEKKISPSGLSGGQTDYYASIATDNATANTVYALYTSGLRRSTNAGDTWSNISGGVVSGNSGASDLIVCPSNNSRLYATNGNSIWRTDNSGTAWSGDLANNTGFTTNATITALAVWPANANVIYAAIGSIQNPGNKVFYSTDAGATWQNISGTLPDVPVLTVAVDQNNNAYIGTDLGVFYQSAGSTDWTPYYNALPRIPVSSLVINQAAGLIRAATYGHGVWQAPLFSTCDANISLSGGQASNLFYEVSNQITSTASVFGGSGTNVIYRAGNEVVLSPGFEVYEHNLFRAYIGPCESGPVPVAKYAAAPWLSHYSLPMSSSSLVPYGNIAVTNTTNEAVAVTITAADTGRFTIALTSATSEDWLLRKETEVTERGVQQYSLATTAVPPGNYVLQLYYKGRLVHYQEWNKSK